jgi:hypothetical protein
LAFYLVFSFGLARPGLGGLWDHWDRVMLGCIQIGLWAIRIWIYVDV